MTPSSLLTIVNGFHIAPMAESMSGFVAAADVE